MSFLSTPYLLFFPLVALGYFALPQRCRALWLLLASGYFYLCTGLENLLFLLLVIGFTYGSAIAMEKVDLSRRKPILVLSLLLLFGVLFLLKYTGFALGMLERFLPSFTAPALDLLVPAGISFYLFMATGYLIDVYRGTQKAQRNPLHLALFLSFFPTILSGPISRGDRLMPQFATPPGFHWDGFRQGLLRFLWGAFLKLVLADRLSMLVTGIYAAPWDYGRMEVFGAACAFSLQIYADFSAYSHMALGTGQMMGFTLMENFRAPYLSRTIADFWRKWHISLTSWFRDYLYVPLGGSRKGIWRKYGHILIVFAVSGLWHGSALTFLVWGLLNGLYQVVGSLTGPARTKVREGLGIGENNPLLILWQGCWVFFFATIAWVFFKGGSFTNSLSLLGHMVTGPWRTATPLPLDAKELLVAFLAILLLFLVDILGKKYRLREGFLALPRLVRWGILLALLFVTLIFGVYGSGYDPQDFIYFKF